jgi:hypothetical protein
MSMQLFEIMAEVLNSPALKGNAYLDPGSGSFILQLILASLVGIGFAFRSYWGKLLGIFRKKSGEEDSSSDEE